jgi:5-methylcytosine-specific restriction endonuclease McrA
MSTKHRVLGTQKWKNKRLAVLQSWGYECYICGGQADQVDHLIPRAKGGDVFDDDNLAAICGRCNRAKGSRFFRGGFDPLVLPDLSLSKTDTLVPESPFEKP